MLGMPDEQPPQQESGEAAGGERKLVRDCWLGAAPPGLGLCWRW